jgi:hypothetical protein
MMELGTTGAILTYALQLDNQIKSFYESIQSKLVGFNKKILETLQNTQRKRIQILKRLRRENVTEMILEPIHDFRSENYSLNLEVSDNENEDVIVVVLRNIQNILHSFFLEAAKKTSFLPNVSLTLKREAECILNNLALLTRT